MRCIDADVLEKEGWSLHRTVRVDSHTMEYQTKPIAKVPTIEPEPQWIPVTERLPEPRTDVWVNSDIGQIQGYYEENVKIWYASFEQGRDYLELIVNAWMPLPEPYAERRTDGSD